MAEGENLAVWSGFNSNAHLWRFVGSLAAILIFVMVVGGFLRLFGLTLKSPEIEIGIAGAQKQPVKYPRWRLNEAGLRFVLTPASNLPTFLYLPINFGWIRA